MKKTNPLNKILAIILGFLIVLTVFFQVISPSSLYQNLDQKIYQPWSRLRYSLIEKPIVSLKTTIENFVSMQTIKEENIELRRYLESMQQLQAQNIALKKDNETLKQLAGVKNSLTSSHVLVATVINRSPALFNDEVLIDIGTKQGVFDNMAVISSKGMIGLIKKAGDNTSTVKLLTTTKDQAKVSVLVLTDNNQELHGVLENYDTETGQFVIRLLDSHTTVRPGAKIITSGLGNIIPKGLLIGTVEELDDSRTTISALLLVKPVANFSDLSYVLAISKTEPKVGNVRD